ncbi:MAG: hypothetical protein ACK5LX_10195 [Oscillospiraceae bacterium]
MARFTITLSADALENLKKAQEILPAKLGVGRVTQGFVIGYVLKQFVENEQEEEK